MRKMLRFQRERIKELMPADKWFELRIKYKECPECGGIGLCSLSCVTNYWPAFIFPIIKTPHPRTEQAKKINKLLAKYDHTIRTK